MRVHQVGSLMTVTTNPMQNVQNLWTINGTQVTQELQAKKL